MQTQFSSLQLLTWNAAAFPTRTIADLFHQQAFNRLLRRL